MSRNAGNLLQYFTTCIKNITVLAPLEILDEVGSNRRPKNNEERTKLERSSTIALHALETEHHADADNPEILSKYWPIYRDRINAEQWFISHQSEACNLKGKTTHPAWNLI